MLELPYTALITGLLALMMIWLSLFISIRRAELSKRIGDLAGGIFADASDHTLQCRIRAFWSFVEYAPICLALLALIESAEASVALIKFVSICILIGRIAHAYGVIHRDNPAMRGVGMLLTYLALLVPACWLLYRVWIMATTTGLDVMIITV